MMRNVRRKWGRLMTWSKHFDEPITLPNGRQLHALRDALQYISNELPMAEYDSAEWQLAIEALMQVADSEAPPVLARVAIVNALNSEHPKVISYTWCRDFPFAGSAAPTP